MVDCYLIKVFFFFFLGSFPYAYTLSDFDGPLAVIWLETVKSPLVLLLSLWRWLSLPVAEAHQKVYDREKSKKFLLLATD